ncbi:MAG: Fic family protein [Motiliproteus sp.]|jgi:Fic family protein
MKDTHWNMPANKKMALFIAKKQLVSLVYDAVKLEGINFTIPEVQTLLEGITVGGHKLSDQTIAVNQGKAWKQLFDWLKQDQFVLSKELACNLHAIAGKEEVMEWGIFRTGQVFISGTDYAPPHCSELDAQFSTLLSELSVSENNDVYDNAIHIFLSMARNQFFYDVNKRMGRFMMNGYLLSHGYPVINVPAKRQLEFNELMIAFYESGDEAPMNPFLRSCLGENAISMMLEAR